MAIAVVQAKMGVRTFAALGTNPDNVLALDSDTVSSNMIVVLASVAFGAVADVPTLTIADSQGLTWQTFGGVVQGRVRQYLFVAEAAGAAPLTVTITASGADTTTGCGLDQAILEISGEEGIEDSGTAGGNSADGNSGAATLVGNGILVAGLTVQGTPGVTEEAGWVLMGESESQTCTFAYKVVSGGTTEEAYNPTHPSANWAGCIVAVHEPVAGGVVIPVVTAVERQKRA
jgi:hypothetical protein